MPLLKVKDFRGAKALNCESWVKLFKSGGNPNININKDKITLLLPTNPLRLCF